MHHPNVWLCTGHQRLDRVPVALAGCFAARQRSACSTLSWSVPTSLSGTSGGPSTTCSAGRPSRPRAVDALDTGVRARFLVVERGGPPCARVLPGYFVIFEC